MKKAFIHHLEKVRIILVLIGIGLAGPARAQRPVKEYNLTIREQKVSKAGYLVKSVTINDSIPGPTLYFTEGDSAVIHIKNDLMMPSSIHWHGILIPNYFDGVPYLSTPPIEPGKTFTVRFPVRQSGTYWYHSHTMFQEQSGLYGAIVIYPKKKLHHYPREMVLMLTDWTNENPVHIMNNLKRNTEWYAIKKRSAQSLVQVLGHHGLGERLKMAWQRMPPMDISDVYYPAFLTNGDRIVDVPDTYPGERIRLRVIDGSSSTFFHLQFSGGTMQIIAADGQEVQPVKVTRMLIGIAETYDLVLTIPPGGKYEFRTTAQDGSGYTSVYFGKGPLHAAPELPKPDLFHMEGLMMKGMAGMKMKMGGMTMFMSQKMMQREMPYINRDYLDREDLNMAGKDNRYMPGMDKGGIDNMGTMPGMDTDNSSLDTNQIPNPSMNGMDMGPGNSLEPSGMDMTGMNQAAGDSIIYNYQMLKALHPTNIDTAGHPVRQLTFNLTGTMWRYNWSINGETLSEDDSIRVKEGELLRITLNNETMMYHPMHLHGHFFRVINGNGSYSPLKHTVIVPPMRKVTIEFLADEPGNWFFHCHILYHMMAGMSRTFQYSGYQLPLIMKKFPISKLLAGDNHWFLWGHASLASNFTEGYLSYSNRKNWIKLRGDYGWENREHELSGTYEYFITPFLRPYAGMVSSNKIEYTRYFKQHGLTIPNQDIRGILGFRYLLPFFLNADLRIDSRAHIRFAISGETWLFPRIWLHYSWNTDQEYEVNLEGRLSQVLSLSAGYNSDYKWGGGLMFRF